MYKKQQQIIIVFPRLSVPRLSGIQLSGRYVLYNVFCYITEVVHTTVHYFNITKATEKT